MEITAQAWGSYVHKLERLNKTASQQMAAYLAAHGTADTDAIITYAEALAQKYGAGSTELACQMYDAVAELQHANVPPAEPAEITSRGEIARRMEAVKDSPPKLAQEAGRLVKQAGADTMLKNAKRDKAEFAWVPNGDSCAFCAMLASRGWQRASEITASGGHAAHIHANCDCEFAIRFSKRFNVAGYDPDKYLKQYRDADGKLNEMRRVDYAANKERINAQKRAAYAARKAREQES